TSIYTHSLHDALPISIIPQISYVDREGDPKDWLYDGVLYLGLASPEGRSFETGTANFKDWKWYLDKTFAQKGDMQQLNEAAKDRSEEHTSELQSRFEL